MKKVRLNVYLPHDTRAAVALYCAQTGASTSGALDVLLRAQLDLPDRVPAPAPAAEGPHA